MTAKMLGPGATVGILGDGQLGRMLAMAASRLGLRTHVFGQEADSPAAQVATAATRAAYDDLAALDRFAAAVDVVTLEFENIPTATLDHLAPQVPTRPGAHVLHVTQDRLLEKDFVTATGGTTAGYRAVDSLADLEAALDVLGLPAVLKTRRFGYDGKGQVKIAARDQAAAAWATLGPAPCILEAWVPFERELSVIVARGTDGRVASYVPVENRHEHHILAVTLAPAEIAPATAAAATGIAEAIAARLDVTGLLAVELFLTADGRVIVNELAPRTHNSGHWTIEGAVTSQFEQQLRAVCGMPLGSPAVIAPAEMRNLIGDAAHDWPKYLADPRAKLHLYGKAEARPGRKMGHVTWLKDR